MAYRYDDKPFNPEEHLPRFEVRNGAIMRIAFGCYYLKGHNPSLHDHIGWPTTNRVDNSCQSKSNMKLYPFKDKTVDLEEIHLTAEGYDRVAIAFEDQTIAESLSASTWVDDADDNIIHVKIGADFTTFSNDTKETKFTIFACNGEDAVDAICHGVVVILPGAPCPSA